MRQRPILLIKYEVLSEQIRVSHFGDDVDAAEQQLVDVSAPHQVGGVDQRVFKARPDFPSQLRGDVQLHAQIPQTYAGQVIHLDTRREKEEEASWSGD